jgi:dihydrofolate reductase
VRAAVQALKEGGDGTAATDTAATDGTTAAHGTAAAHGGAPILVPGSASLVRSLLVWGLVDELRLLTYPVLVGGGVRIFPDDREKWAFELTALERFESGAVLHVYRLAGS